jgi:ribulose-phosphate 3-epimerase
MPTICPTVLAASLEDYGLQMKKIAHLGQRVQIDLTDGNFAPSQTVGPDDIWWPAGFEADIHLMYKQPELAAEIALKHQPSMIIVHQEAEFDLEKIYKSCRDKDTKLGLAILPATPAEGLVPYLDRVDHVLIFSGQLGSFGGAADLSLLDKVAYLKKVRPDLEIGWDGGVNNQNISELVLGGVDVLNVGGFIQKSSDPAGAYAALFRIADETGST